MDDLIAIAKIAKPRGINGEVVADFLTDFPDRFEGLENVTAVLPGGATRELKIEDHWFQQERVVLKFAEVDSIDSAERLRNAEICVPDSEAVELETGEFYDWQLEGCRVETTDGIEVGIVAGLMRTTGTENLIVEGTREFLIPFAQAICVEVDIDNKVIVIDPPEGLLDF